MPGIPTGFAPLARSSPYLELLGPVHQKRHGGSLVIGLRASGKHCNGRGQVHGGVLAALADIAMGHSAAFSTLPPTPLVTVSQTIDYLDKADTEDWIEVHTDVQKIGRRLAFANCCLSVGPRQIARASAVFSVPA